MPIPESRTAIMTIGQLLGHKLTSDDNMAVRQCFNYMVWRTYQQNNGVSGTIKATVAMSGFLGSGISRYFPAKTAT